MTDTTPTFRDRVREIMQGHGFSGDRTAALCHALYLDGDPGDVYFIDFAGSGVAVYGRRLTMWNDAGFHYSDIFGSPAAARLSAQTLAHDMGLE